MKLFVATERGQGLRKTDFNNAEPGELLTFVSECDGEAIDGRCGCRRAMAGMTSHMATTTFEVAEVDLDLDGLMAAVREALSDGGWLKYGSVAENDQWVAEDAHELVRLAEGFPVGALVERRGDAYQTRDAESLAS